MNKMEEKKLIDIVRKEVIQKAIIKAGGLGGDNLNDKKVSIVELKDILYSTLMDIELKEVKERWGMD